MSDRFFCPHFNTEVELSESRAQHIIETHPGTLPNYRVVVIHQTEPERYWIVTAYTARKLPNRRAQ